MATRYHAQAAGTIRTNLTVRLRRRCLTAPFAINNLPATLDLLLIKLVVDFLTCSTQTSKKNCVSKKFMYVPFSRRVRHVGRRSGWVMMIINGCNDVE